MSGLLLDVVLRAAESGSSESLGDAAGVGCLDVEPASWPVVLRAARDVGAWLDWLGGVDDGSGGTQVVALVQTEYEDVLVRTQLGADEDLESVREVFEGADWHERETAEMLGVRFVGGDHRPLLLPAGTPPPLRRGTPLERRLSTPWPGAREAGRRARVPGINKEWERP
ncbi:MAG: NADH-quinone oxidoreductase subunit C [Candidatus Nanopelagicales bacterium]